MLWLGLTHPRGTPDCAFIYDIEIDEAHRGAGYGRVLLTAAVDAVRSHGLGAVELNVYGDNARDSPGARSASGARYADAADAQTPRSRSPRHVWWPSS